MTVGLQFTNRWSVVGIDQVGVFYVHVEPMTCTAGPPSVVLTTKLLQTMCQSLDQRSKQHLRKYVQEVLGDPCLLEAQTDVPIEKPTG